MDGSLLVSQSRSLSCSYVPSMSIQQDRNSMVCCCAACTLGIKHIEISICADSDDAASDDGTRSFSMQGKHGATNQGACMPAVEKQR